jgi:hypothetical protein
VGERHHTFFFPDERENWWLDPPIHQGECMTTLMTIVTIVFCIGVVFAIVGHLGIGIARDKNWRERIGSHHEARRRWSRRASRVTT